MSDKITITYSIALILESAMNKILYDEQGNERMLPFGIKYRIGKNKAYIDKDVADFNNIKLKLIATFGDPTEDGKDVVVTDPTKKQMFISAMNELLLTEVSHYITKLKTEELETLNLNIDVDYNTLKIFQAYMCDEPELFKDLTTDINIEFKDLAPATPPSEEAVVEEKPKKTRKPRKKKEETPTNE